MTRRPLVVASAAATAAAALSLALAGCSGDDAAPAATASTAPVASVSVDRWWSNSAAPAGSRIDAARPDRAATKLSPSRTDYCGMLRQTIAAGKSILPNATATDPALRVATTAFVAELRAVAPSPVSGAWRTLGTALVDLVRAGGDPAKVRGGDPKATAAAVRTIAADAKGQCRVNLAQRS